MTETDAQRAARVRYQQSWQGRETARQRNARADVKGRRVERNASAAGRAEQSAFKARRRAKVKAIAEAAGCADCGTIKDLHFHHRDPDMKLFPISRGCGLAWIRVAAEIEKCDVLCGPCHRKRHYG